MDGVVDASAALRTTSATSDRSASRAWRPARLDRREEELDRLVEELDRLEQRVGEPGLERLRRP